ncbi:hypothetical protein BRADI_1g11795v3 [Brachypodium distachyon]|uniref:Uncharacterized protein n=1 Tax=Brachypodium distachyon TaxID=15368 RepID=A0A2K2DJ23_BRADI|nr:hypothetical protein BRADI_1g11795v3 [Brachypodium distachyon]
MERAAEAARRKVADLEMAIYALGGRPRDAVACRCSLPGHSEAPTCFRTD